MAVIGIEMDCESRKLNNRLHNAPGIYLYPNDVNLIIRRYSFLEMEKPECSTES